MQHNFHFLQYGVVACITFAVVIALRPSEHGLANQRDPASSPAANQNGDANKMLSSFFASTTTPSVPLPEAQSIGGEGGGDTWRSGGGSRDLRRDHVRLGLLAAAAICGFAGVVLLVVSGVVYHLRRRREKAGAE